MKVIPIGEEQFRQLLHCPEACHVKLMSANGNYYIVEP